MLPLLLTFFINTKYTEYFKTRDYSELILRANWVIKFKLKFIKQNYGKPWETPK